MTEKKRQYIFSIGLILGLFFPDNAVGNIVLGLLPIVLFTLLSNRSQKSKSFLFKLFWIVILLSLVVNAYILDDITSKSLLRFLSYTSLFLLFPFVGYTKVYNSALYMSLLFILVSQIAYSFGIPFLVQFFDLVYPYKGDYLSYSSDILIKHAGDLESIVNTRYGGLYHNPNQAVRYVSLIFIVFLLQQRGKSFSQKFLMITLAFMSVLLSGSRTGFVVWGGIILYDIFIFNKEKMKKNLLLILIVGLALSIGIFSYLAQFQLRTFDVSQGFDDSFSAKLGFFNFFYQQLTSPINFLIGHFSSDSIDALYHIKRLDSEWGELFYSFGVLGVFTLLSIYLKLWLTKDSHIRFFMLILLWGLSSTILFSFRMSFLFMLILSNYYSFYLMKKSKI